MNRPEIHSEEAINRLLAGLRDVEAPQGMESRILVRLEDRTVAPRHLLFTAPQAWAFATACFALATLALAWATTHHTHHAVRERAIASPNFSPKVLHVQDAGSTPIRTAQRQTHKQVRQTKLIPTAPESASETTEDTLALSDLNAPSKPAPPMPLTDQEKLLLRLVHKGDPIELAMLDPKFRSSEEANSRADFDRFFAPPPLPDIKPANLDIKSNLGDKK